MTVAQAWILAGIPALAIAVIALIGRGWWRALVGYGALLAAFGVLVTVDRASAALFAVLIALVYASGRGGRQESEPFDGTAGSRALQRAGDPGLLSRQ